MPALSAIWRPLAEKGDADAQFNLGQAYRLGRGVPTNLSPRRPGSSAPRNQGHVDAQATLGLLLFQSGDQAGGLRWLKGAARQGRATRAAGLRHRPVQRRRRHPGPGSGLRLVSRAAAQGLAPAKETLAQMDKILPLADRKKGVAIAIANARKAPAPKSRTITVKPPRRAQAGAAGRSFGDCQAEARARRRCRRAPAQAGAWRVQLGAFSQKSSAEALFRKLSGSGALAGRQAYYIPVGAITRLQAGPFDSPAPPRVPPAARSGARPASRSPAK